MVSSPVADQVLWKPATVARAPEQRLAQKFFQRGDLPRHGALRQRQFLRGARVALMPCRRLEAEQGMGGGNFAAHARAVSE